MEACEHCGFTWEIVGREDIGPRSIAGSLAIAAMLVGEPVRSLQRPSAQRWSMMEYGAHVRDVLLTVRDRLVIGLVEEHPDFKPLYRDERIGLGLYRTDTVPAVAQELGSAAAMFGRLFEVIDPELLSRTGQYAFPSPASRTLLWMGQQVVHEVEHHRGDVEENLRLVSATD